MSLIIVYRGLHGRCRLSIKTLFINYPKLYNYIVIMTSCYNKDDLVFISPMKNDVVFECPKKKSLCDQ